jgi:YegS/Rv2252/BmrU family lipid kinase
MRRALLIYNPIAGRYPSWLLTERAARVLQKEGWEIEIVTTQDGDHVTRLARQAASEGMDAFFVAGGDGSVNRAVRGLLGSDTALGVLPAGTANVWAQELGLPGLSWTRLMALEESAQRLANAQVCPVDVGICNSIPFLLWAGVGLDAFIVHRIEPRTPWERHFAVVQYAASAVVNASQWHGLNLKAISDGQEITGQFVLAVVSNIHLYAGGYAELSPDALLDDGMMDLWLFEGKNLEDILQQAWDLWAGRHTRSSRVHRIPFQKITLQSDSHMYVQVDGEPENSDREVSIQVLPRALRILVPEKAPRALFGQTLVDSRGDTTG